MLGLQVEALLPQELGKGMYLNGKHSCVRGRDRSMANARHVRALKADGNEFIAEIALSILPHRL